MEKMRRFAFFASGARNLGNVLFSMGSGGRHAGRKKYNFFVAILQTERGTVKIYLFKAGRGSRQTKRIVFTTRREGRVGLAVVHSPRKPCGQYKWAES